MDNSFVPVVTDYSSRSQSGFSARRNHRPVGTVIHTSSGTDSTGWLLGEGRSKIGASSADTLITRRGEIRVIVPFDRYSFHAGVSRWGQFSDLTSPSLNEAFIGIELECLDTEYVTTEQYIALAGTILNKALAYSWQLPYIILGHYVVARPRGRRSDPLGFDMGLLNMALAGEAQRTWWKG